MKVSGPSKTSGPKGPSKTGSAKTGDGEFESLIHAVEETSVASSVARTAPVGALDALLSIQADEGGNTGQRKAKRRATDLLDTLDQIRTGLLTGELSKSTIQQLSRTIAQQREGVTDPKLAEILDDIELRAAVELAKLER